MVNKHILKDINYCHFLWVFFYCTKDAVLVLIITSFIGHNKFCNDCSLLKQTFKQFIKTEYWLQNIPKDFWNDFPKNVFHKILKMICFSVLASDLINVSFQGPHSDLRQWKLFFLATESPLKMMNKAFH